METFAIAGCGHLGSIVYKAYIKGLLPGYKLVATYSMKTEDAKALTEGTDAKALSSMEEVIAIKPDYIVETASIALLKEFAIKALESNFPVPKNKRELNSRPAITNFSIFFPFLLIY